MGLSTHASLNGIGLPPKHSKLLHLTLASAMDQGPPGGLHTSKVCRALPGSIPVRCRLPAASADCSRAGRVGHQQPATGRQGIPTHSHCCCLGGSGIYAGLDFVAVILFSAFAFELSTNCPPIANAASQLCMWAQVPCNCSCQ